MELAGESCSRAYVVAHSKPNKCVRSRAISLVKPLACAALKVHAFVPGTMAIPEGTQPFRLLEVPHRAFVRSCGPVQKLHTEGAETNSQIPVSH